MKKLLMQKENSRCFIRGYSVSDVFVRRVTSAGLVPDTELIVVRNRKRNPILVYVRDSLVALSRNDCAKIIVEEIEL